MPIKTPAAHGNTIIIISLKKIFKKKVFGFREFLPMIHTLITFKIDTTAKSIYLLTVKDPSRRNIMLL